MGYKLSITAPDGKSILEAEFNVDAAPPKPEPVTSTVDFDTGGFGAHRRITIRPSADTVPGDLAEFKVYVGQGNKVSSPPDLANDVLLADIPGPITDSAGGSVRQAVIDLGKPAVEFVNDGHTDYRQVSARSFRSVALVSNEGRALKATIAVD